MKEKIILTGLIDQHMANFILDGLDEDQAAEVWICSRGGEVGAALAIHDAFRRHGNVTAIATGECQSAALLAFLGAKRRMATPNTIFLNHAIEGELAEVFPEAMSLPAVEAMKRYYPGIFTSEEALERGVIDTIWEGEKVADPEGPALQAENQRAHRDVVIHFGCGHTAIMQSPGPMDPAGIYQETAEAQDSGECYDCRSR